MVGQYNRVNAFELLDIYQEIDGAGVCDAVYLDLAKAFDTVSHDIPVTKMSHPGFRYGVTNWVKSYLLDRIQQTVMEGRFSTPKQMKCGVDLTASFVLILVSIVLLLVWRKHVVTWLL